MRGRTAAVWGALRRAGRACLRRLRRWTGPLVVLGLLAAYLVAAPIAWEYAGSARYRTSVARVPAAPVGLVFGAGLSPGGYPSPFLQGRLRIAAGLYRTGKVRVLLVTGDNGRHSYDEPTAMRNYLIALGVPGGKIVEDYAGFDTWDSCVRAKKIFGVTKATVITQLFHLPRAVTLCRAAGIDAFGVGDDTMRTDRQVTEYGYFREVFAAIKAVGSVTLRPSPRFLGRREPGVQQALGQ